MLGKDDFRQPRASEVCTMTFGVTVATCELLVLTRKWDVGFANIKP